LYDCLSAAATGKVLRNLFDAQVVRWQDVAKSLSEVEGRGWVQSLEHAAGKLCFW